METTVDVIAEMVEKGNQKIAEALAEAEQLAEATKAARRAAWQALNEAARQAYPEALRPFVWHGEARREDPNEIYGDVTRLEMIIEIPGFAPIDTTVKRARVGEAFELVADKSYRYSAEACLYRVPVAYEDYEFGLMWSWDGGLSTNDLEVALAAAQQAMATREAIGLRIEERNQKRAADEAKKAAEAHVREVLDLGEHSTLMDELIAIIRDVAREEIQAAQG